MTPGPGSYQTKEDGKLKKSPAWALGKGKRTTLKGSDAPGPGNYNPKRGPEGPQYSMAGKAEVRRSALSPGPGNYNVEVVERGVAHVIGTETKGGRDLTTRKEVPGPGQYELKTAKDSRAYGFGTSKREHGKETEIPGPGSY